MGKLFKIIPILFAFVCVSCTQDESLSEFVYSGQNQEPSSRAVSDIFNVEKINLPEGTSMYEYITKGVDRDGNFYCIAFVDASSPISNGIDYKYAILKYDNALGRFVFFAPYRDEAYNYVDQLCFDEKNNLCYVLSNYPGPGDKLRRIKADGSGMIDQPLDFPSFDYRRRYFKGISVAANGNIFFLIEYSLENAPSITKLYRLTPNGQLTDLEIDGLVCGYAHGLYKANGAILYTYDGQYEYSKINTNTKEVIHYPSRFKIDFDGIATSPNKANMYAINGNYVMQIRPNAASDLTVGSIPNRYIDETGQFVELESNFDQLFVNWDATEFFTFDRNARDHIFKFTF